MLRTPLAAAASVTREFAYPGTMFVETFDRSISCEQNALLQEPAKINFDFRSHAAQSRLPMLM
jgi:hypothetical protein